MGQVFQEHLSNLREVFDRLRVARLKLKPRKCNLVKQEVKYLGYVVSNAGVCADLDKVRAVKDFPRPQNLKQLRSFLGLASYYRRFIQKFKQVAAPLYALNTLSWRQMHLEQDWELCCPKNRKMGDQSRCVMPVGFYKHTRETMVCPNWRRWQWCGQ